MKKIILIIFFLFNCAFANLYENPVKFASLKEKLPELKSAKLKFTQEKYFKNAKKPIISRGDFEFIKNKGVYFKTTYPIQKETSYTNQNYKQINEIINAISNKKYSKLDDEFDFYYEKTAQEWLFGLKPVRGVKTSDFIVSITLKGNDEYINKIEITQTNGNRTILRFFK